MKREYTRRDPETGDRIAVITAYAPGDGKLSFVARDPQTSKATLPSPTKEECRAACPEGWEIYPDGPYFRAHKRSPDAPEVCDGCNGTGFRETEDSDGVYPPDGFTFIERCDKCGIYESDEAAATAHAGEYDGGVINENGRLLARLKQPA